MEKYNINETKVDSDFFKALGHPIRLWIVKQLHQKEYCVCDFVDAIGVKFSTISQHLRILKQAGIIVDDKRGKSVFYSLKCSCVLDILKCKDNKE